jgi:hypothetical protein
VELSSTISDDKCKSTEMNSTELTVASFALKGATKYTSSFVFQNFVIKFGSSSFIQAHIIFKKPTMEFSDALQENSRKLPLVLLIFSTNEDFF